MGSNELTPQTNRVDGISSIKENIDGDFTVTLKKDRFEEVLFGFLGNKESMSKTYQLDFLIKLEDILQFHYLLIQKIEKEQFTSLSLVTATLSYDNDTTRTVNTIETLERFNEFRELAVKSLQVTWNLVFKNTASLEIQQQEISIFFKINDATKDLGNININIKHTNQLWATEVINLFEEQIKTITIKYTRGYRWVKYIKNLKFIDLVTGISIAVLLLGGLYILFVRDQLIKPIKVKEEFIFDLADVIEKSKANEKSDLLLQFIILKDLENTQPEIIRYLNDDGFIHPKFQNVVNNMISGYYKTEKQSEKLSYSFQSKLQQLKQYVKLSQFFKYYKLVVVYLLFTALGSLYLRLFKMNSIIAITNKGKHLLDHQEKKTSVTLQLIYGIIASIIAALIFEYGWKVLILTM